jgi:hypothetical protein
MYLDLSAVAWCGGAFDRWSGVIVLQELPILVQQQIAQTGKARILKEGSAYSFSRESYFFAFKSGVHGLLVLFLLL